MAYVAQRLISSFETGVGNRILHGFFVLAFAGAAFGLYATSRFRGLTDARAMELAQLGRNIAQGQGFTTQCLRPVDFVPSPAGERPGALQPLPDVRHAPLFPYVLSLGFRIARPSYAIPEGGAVLDAESRVVLPIGIALSILTGLVVFLIGARLFDGAIAFLSMALFFVTEPVLAAGISGTSFPLQMFLGAAAVYLAIVAAQGSRSGKWIRGAAASIGAGLVAGAGILSGYALCILAIALALFLAVACRNRPWLAVVLFVATVAATVAPWLCRNVTASGRVLGLAPHVMLNETVLYAADGFDRTSEYGVRGIFLLRALRYKLLANAGQVVGHDIGTLGGGFVLSAFFLISFIGSFERDEANQLRWCVGFSLFVMLLGSAVLGSPAPGLTALLLPVTIVYGVAFFYATMDAHDLINTAWQPFLVWLVVLLTAFPAGLQVVAGSPAWPYPPYHVPFVRYVCGLLESDEVMCTDIPWATAWYGDRTSLLLPESVDDLTTLRRTRGPISALYLTTETTDRAYVSEFQSGRWQSWLPVVNGTVPTNFPFGEGFSLPPDSREQLFLTDRPRW